jgi:hypothetical protein
MAMDKFTRIRPVRATLNKGSAELKGAIFGHITLPEVHRLTLYIHTIIFGLCKTK